MTFTQNQRQNGFALIDVMLATLVLSLAVIAFVKLNNISLKRAHQTRDYLAATAVANSAIEALRASPNLGNWLTGHQSGNITVVTRETLTASPINCPDTTACSPDSATMNSDLFHSLQHILSSNFQYAEGKAILCLRSATGENSTPIRVVVVWKLPYKNNEGKAAFSPASNSDCPASYSAVLPNRDTLDTQSPSLGYVEQYTRI